MLKIVEKLKELVSHELWIKFFNQINGRLMLKLIMLKSVVFVMMLGILFGYIGRSENKVRFNMTEDLDYSQKLTNTILTKVDGYYKQLILLAYLSEKETTNLVYQPISFNNFTISNDTFTEKYIIQHKLNQNNISLYRSLYKATEQMDQEGWQQTIKLAQIDKYILEMMFNYDDMIIFFHQYYLINKINNIIHYFPVIENMNESYLQLEQQQQILYSNETIIFSYPTSYGMVLGIGNTSVIGQILQNLESSFFIKIFKTDNSFYVSNFQSVNGQCECQMNRILNISFDCEMPSGDNNYYSSGSCNSLYVRDISTNSQIKIYLMILLMPQIYLVWHGLIIQLQLLFFSLIFQSQQIELICLLEILLILLNKSLIKLIRSQAIYFKYEQQTRYRQMIFQQRKTLKCKYYFMSFLVYLNNQEI
ncbi:unnamed protein product (macronuclear) [Paramecium tetraurelia]|uniref:Transmembrane protein n=1 Tax=Paramecium tetraurelia TaxID=5888 RepID=A0D6B9_PARTE|nr:uncharacterized protein GSPATT00001627001 [Paramecium tetraurelia]CAK78586.1 unnamed protein product [Paramecium tetraurelia]|eukprot:XP_001445983.1 hypothetical protein (macronuclear) [Paramecium tetraurelia strain d4-2]